MPLVIPETNLPDPPDFDEFQLTADIVGGYLQVTENPVELELVYGRYGGDRKTERMVVPIGSYNVGRSPDGSPLSGVRARSATAGVTGVLAGYFWTAADPTLAFVGVPQGGGGGVNSARVFRSTNQTLPLGSTTTISFDQEVFDNGNMWELASPTRLTVPVGGDGKYLVGAHAVSGAIAANDLSPLILLNGSTVIGVGAAQGTTANVASVAVVTLWEAVAGDFFEFQIRNVSVAGRVCNSVAGSSPIFYASRLP